MWAHRHFNSWNAEVSWERRKMAGVFINCIEITDSWSHWQVINKSSHRVSTVLSSRIDEKLRNYLIISQPMDLLRVKASRKINKPLNWIGLGKTRLQGIVTRGDQIKAKFAFFYFLFAEVLTYFNGISI